MQLTPNLYPEIHHPTCLVPCVKFPETWEESVALYVYMGALAFVLQLRWEEEDAVLEVFFTRLTGDKMSSQSLLKQQSCVCGVIASAASGSTAQQRGSSLSLGVGGGGMRCQHTLFIFL